MATRAEIVAKAREYTGTPFRHQGRVKGAALDCVGLLMCVGEDLALVDTTGQQIVRTAYNDYSSQPLGTMVLDLCRKHLILKSINNMRAGDILCMKVPIDPTHVGIVTEHDGNLYMVHAYSAGGAKDRCIEHIIDAAWRRRIVAVFEYPGTVD